jgi:hypothetical protein
VGKHKFRRCSRTRDHKISVHTLDSVDTNCSSNYTFGVTFNALILGYLRDVYCNCFIYPIQKQRYTCL